MKISPFQLNNYVSIHKNDSNGRDIGYSTISHSRLVGSHIYYPNVLLLDNTKRLFSPYDETCMSLNISSFYSNNEWFPSSLTKTDLPNSIDITDPVFFFIYNFDNYYHFLYDTLPYLYTFLYIKISIPSLKLLVYYPKNKTKFYDFNTDILCKFVDIKQDLILAETNHIYHTMIVSSSLTHGGLSNYPPRSEIYNLYDNIQIANTITHLRIEDALAATPHMDAPRPKSGALSSLKTLERVAFICDVVASPLMGVLNEERCTMSSPKYIYISRRTWIHNNLSNIGTNYTTRRKMMNEDLLVEKLTEYGICEIFTENLSIDEKISLFKNAKLIIGSIGGGMANLLFSTEIVKSLVIVTPFFLDINNRFRYSLEHTDIEYFTDVNVHRTSNTIPLFCRCKIKRKGDFYDKIGEIKEYNNDRDTERYLINISDNNITGFNNDDIFRQEWFDITEFALIDNGLNSPYVVDVDKLCNRVKDILSYI